MNILTYFIQILRRVISRVIRRQQRAMTTVKFDTGRRCLFNDKQLYVIDYGVRLGLDINRYAKPKYTGEQMRVLMYAQMLNIDDTPFNSYSITAHEMEYQLYLAAIEKYLGKGYLRKVLKSEHGTLTDNRIRLILDKALSESLSALQEVAVTEFLIPELRKHDCKDASYVYNTIMHLCKDRCIPTSDVKYSDNIDALYKAYEQAFTVRLCIESHNIIRIKDLNALGELQPPLKDCLQRRDLLDTIEPVYIVNGNTRDKYYLNIIGDILYLSNQDTILAYSY